MDVIVGTGVLDCPIKSKKAAEDGVFACGLQASDIACIKKSTCPAVTPFTQCNRTFIFME
jgi:hypothetical protein